MKNIFVVIAIVFFCSFILDEAIKKDFIAINKKMNTAKSYLAKIRVVYDNVKSDQVYTSYSKKMNNCFAYSFNGNTVLGNNKYLIAVNDDSKLICVQNAEEAEEVDEEKILSMLDTIFDKRFNYVFEKKVGEFKVVKTIIADEKSPYTEIRIMYHSTKHYFKEIEHVCSAKVQKKTGLLKIKIIYDEFNFSPSISEKDFSETEFVHVKGKNKIIPADKYKNYRIIDQRLER